MYSTHCKHTLYKMSFVCETILKTRDVKVRRPWDRLTPIEQLTAFSSFPRGNQLRLHQGKMSALSDICSGSALTEADFYVTAL